MTVGGPIGVIGVSCSTLDAFERGDILLRRRRSCSRDASRLENQDR